MDMNSHWIQKSLEYHGLPLKSIWDGERGEQDLIRLGLNNNIDYTTYRNRCKNLGLAERRVRHRLHQFIAKNAPALFDQRLVDSVSSTTVSQAARKDLPVIDNAPPYECFLEGQSHPRVERIFNTIQPGDLVYSKSGSRKPTCITGRLNYYTKDLQLKIFYPQDESLVRAPKVSCHEVDVVDRHFNQILLKTTEHQPDAFPAFYNFADSTKVKSYQEYFDQSQHFKSPHCHELLYEELNLDSKEHYTNMANARGRYPPQEYAEDIRQKQASKLAFRSVAEGIEHFKEGRHSEAFQCLNKALSIDARNVEGLVARGALYANSGSFKKAVEDFETALKLNPAHANARKYMGETLVALGRSYEDENNLEAAKKAYQDCLMIIPLHEEAQTSLDFLKTKIKPPPLIEPGELQLPQINFGDTGSAPGTAKKDDGGKRDKKDKKSKKNKKSSSKNKKKYSSSSSSSGSSDEDNDSSDDSSDSDSDSSSSSDSDANKKKKKKDKKLAGASSSMVTPVGKVGGVQAPPPPAISNDYEIKVRNFLSDMNRDEDNYEEKVRRFVEETSKYRKDREKASSSEKKKKRKESKKSKKESRKQKKKDKGSKKKGKDASASAPVLGDEEKLREALKIFENFPILDELGSKLQSLYGKDKKLTDPAPSAVTVGHVAAPPVAQSAADPQQGKWKMMFAKDTTGNQPSSTSSSKPSTLTPLSATSSSSHHNKHSSSTTTSLSKSSAFAKDDSDDERRRRGKKSPSPVLVPIPPRPKYARLLSPASMNRPAPIRSGPVVLDKFGNFRLAQAEPEQLLEQQRRNQSNMSRRSRSRRRSSRSSSRSRSPVGNRRRSRSFRSRSRGSRSSRSYSRSRSRSGSRDRWRSGGGGNRFRGGRGGGGNGGHSFFEPRFRNNNSHGNNGPRGGQGGGGMRGRGGRDWEFRQGGGRGGNRDSGFRPRGGRGNNGGRFNDRRFDRMSRSRSFSPQGRMGGGQRSPDMNMSNRGRENNNRMMSPEMRSGRDHHHRNSSRSPVDRTRSQEDRMGRQGRSPGRKGSPSSSNRGGHRRGDRDRRSGSKETNTSSSRKDKEHKPTSPSPRKSSGGRRSPSPGGNKVAEKVKEVEKTSDGASKDLGGHAEKVEAKNNNDNVKLTAEVVSVHTAIEKDTAIPVGNNNGMNNSQNDDQEPPPPGCE